MTIVTGILQAMKYFLIYKERVYKEKVYKEKVFKRRIVDTAPKDYGNPPVSPAISEVWLI